MARDPDKMPRAECIREDGTNRREFLRGEVECYEWKDVGSSYILPELLVAFLYAQLENMERITERRQAVYTRYPDASGATRGHPSTRHTRRTHHQLSYVLHPAGERTHTRAVLIEHLKERGDSRCFPLRLAPCLSYGSGHGLPKRDAPRDRGCQRPIAQAPYVLRPHEHPGRRRSIGDLELLLW